jgi:hypothetical protein
MAKPIAFSNPSMTPTDVDQRRKLAMALMQQGTDASPVGHWTQGLARVLQGGMGGYYGRTASDGEKEGIASRGAFMQQAMKDPSGAAASGIGNAWTTDMAGNIGQKVIGQRLEQSDPMYQLRRQAAQNEVDMAPLRRQALEADITGKGLSQKVTEANLAQLKTQTPEYRASVAEQYGLQRGTPEFNAFVISGTYSAPDPIMQSIAEKLRGNAQPAPSPIRPQSYNSQEGAPGVVLTQAGGQPQQTPPMVNIPGMGQMPKDQAETLGLGLALKGKGDAGKMVMDGINADRLGKEAANENDKKALAAVEGLQRIRTIASGFKPEWLTYENKAKQYGISWADSFEATRKKIPPDMLKDHVEYTMFKRDAISNLTQGIKDATGAAMGIQEEARIRAGLPDPEKDGPTAFEAKFKGAAREYGLTIARTQYLRRNGFQGDGNAAAMALPIGQFSQMIQQRTNQLQQQILQQNPQADPAQIQQAVKQGLQAEFGLGI